MTGRPFISEALRQDIVQQGWAREPVSGALVARAGWTPPSGADPRFLAALADGFVWDPKTGTVTP